MTVEATFAVAAIVAIVTAFLTSRWLKTKYAETEATNKADLFKIASRCAEAERESKRLDAAHARAIKQAIATVDANHQRRRIPEDEIVSAFMRLYRAYADTRKRRTLTDIHSLSRSLEQTMADVFAHDGDRCLLIEFKKTRPDFRLELDRKSETRGPQIAKIRGDPEMSAISLKCHFAGWDTAEQRFTIEFASYLETWTAFEREVAAPPPLAVDKFVTGFLPENEIDATIGAAAADFECYVEMLESAAPPGSKGADDVSLLLVTIGSRGPRFLQLESMAELISALKVRHQVSIKSENTLGPGPSISDRSSQRPRGPRL